MTNQIHPTDPRYQQALDNHYAEFGMRLDEILLPTQWVMMEINGAAQIMLNEGGMRALALMAPRPDASEFTEALIEHIRGTGHRLDE